MTQKENSLKEGIISAFRFSCIDSLPKLGGFKRSSTKLKRNELEFTDILQMERLRRQRDKRN